LYAQKDKRMKVYFYKDNEVGVPWPGPDADRHLAGDYPEPRFIWYDWPGAKETDSPAEADVFVVRQRLIWLSNEQVRQLPYLRGNEQRHVFFDLGSDGSWKCYRNFSDIPAIFIRGCCTQEMLKADPDIVAWPWPTVDMGAYADRSFRYDVVFQGQLTNDLGRRAVESVGGTPGLNVHIQVNPKFFAYEGAAKKQALAASYPETMAAGRLHLVPTSVPAGICRYRLYEGMSMARVGVSLCNGCVHPLADRINWHDCIVTIREGDATHAGAILAEWLTRHTDGDIQEMGRYAQAMWRKWLARDRWAEVIGQIVREKMSIDRTMKRIGLDE